MNVHGLKQRSAECGFFLSASGARRANSDWPDVRDLIEVPRWTVSMSYRPLAAELVKAESLTMAFVAKDIRESAGIKMTAPGTIVVNEATIGKLRSVQLIEFR